MNKVRKEVVYTTVLVLLAFFSVGYTGCKKTEATSPDDGCGSIVCQNGGSCFKGVCTCPVGYEGNLCQTKSAGKYIGTWKWEETIETSSDQSKVGTKRTYTINVTQSSSLAYELNVSDFRGNTNYDDVLWRLGWQYVTDDKGVETEAIALPTQFIFTKKQVLKGSRITLERGSGTVNSTGTFMSGTYVITEPDSTGGVYRETCKFAAGILQ